VIEKRRVPSPHQSAESYAVCLLSTYRPMPRASNPVPKPKRKAAPKPRASFTLSSMLTRERLILEAGEGAFGKGNEYARWGHVRVLENSDSGISAAVTGSYLYIAYLRAGRKELVWYCSCPHFGEGNFCKHLVATGLVWLNGGKPVGDSNSQDATVDSKRRVKHRRVAKTTGVRDQNHVWMDEQRQRIEQVSARIRDRWLSPQKFIEIVNPIAVDLRKALGKRPADVMMVAERLITRLSSVPDRHGISAYLVPALDAFIPLHRDACAKVSPDRRAFARQLFDMMMQLPWDALKDAPAVYGNVLGDAGLQELYAIAESEWSAYPVLTEANAELLYDERRRRLGRLLEFRARDTDDLDALMRVRQKRLVVPSDYQFIAEMYHRSGSHGEALAWVLRCIEVFGKRTDLHVYEVGVEVLHRVGDDPRAAELAWSTFEVFPDVPSYMLLRKVAMWSDSWNPWRERALALLRGDIERGVVRTSIRGVWRSADGTLLVQLLLAEPSIDDAWEAAVDYDCSNELWLALARARALSNPEDSIAVYKTLVDAYLNGSYSDRHARAAELVKEAGTLLRRMRKPQAFAEYLHVLRTTYRRSRKFMELLKEVEGSEGVHAADDDPSPPDRSHRSTGKGSTLKRR
jgi:uncharacterized Zn finger protein